MGKRGPQPGWKLAKAGSDLVAPVSHADTMNPAKLSGDALRRLAHNMGMAKSVMASRTDEQVRADLRYANFRAYGTVEET